MLAGPFAESNRAIIALEEDNPNALCYALEIIYARFGEEHFVAKKMTTEWAIIVEELDLDQNVAKDVVKESPYDDEEWQEVEASMIDELEALVDKYDLVVVRNYQEEVERRVEVTHLRTKVKTLEKEVKNEANEKASAMGMMSTMRLQLGYSGNVIWRMQSMVIIPFGLDRFSMRSSHIFSFFFSVFQEMQNMRQTQGICESFNHSTTRMYEENMRLRQEISRLKHEVVRTRKMNGLSIDELMGQG